MKYLKVELIKEPFRIDYILKKMPDHGLNKVEFFVDKLIILENSEYTEHISMQKSDSKNEYCGRD